MNPQKKHCHIKKVEEDKDAIVSCFETWQEDVPIYIGVRPRKISNISKGAMHGADFEGKVTSAIEPSTPAIKDTIESKIEKESI